jgi:hypothetical protein
MKKCICILTLFITFAARSQVQFGLFAGPQVTGVRYIINEVKQESSLKMGVNLGGQFKIPLEYRLTFAPSIMYNLRGYKVNFNSPSLLPEPSAVDNNTSFHTVELGFLFQHDFKLEPGHCFFRIGPSLDFALFGKEEYNTASSSVSRNMKFSFGDYGHYLASAIFQFGYESKNGTFAYAHYNYSLTTMNNADYGPKIGNRAAGISIGKYLKK